MDGSHTIEPCEEVAGNADQTGLLEWFGAVDPLKPRLIIAPGMD
jgi:hypothetical protein